MDVNLPDNAGNKGCIPGLRVFLMPRNSCIHVPQILSQSSGICKTQEPVCCSY